MVNFDKTLSKFQLRLSVIKLLYYVSFLFNMDTLCRVDKTGF